MGCCGLLLLLLRINIVLLLVVMLLMVVELMLLLLLVEVMLMMVKMVVVVVVVEVLLVAICERLLLGAHQLRLLDGRRAGHLVGGATSRARVCLVAGEFERHRGAARLGAVRGNANRVDLRRIV